MTTYSNIFKADKINKKLFGFFYKTSITTTILNFLLEKFRNTVKVRIITFLSKKSIFIHPTSLPVFNIFYKYISSNFSDGNRALQLNFEISRPTLFVKQDDSQKQLNNFEIFRRLKSHDNEFLSQEVYYVVITKEEYPINQCLFELFQTVSLNYRELDLEVIYLSLRSILDDDVNPLKIDEKIFSKEMFSQMIGVSAKTLHRRIKSYGSVGEQ